jgi:hypothetical protein
MADYDITVTVPNQGPPGPQGPPGITDASLLDSGTLADARLSSNVPLKDASNTFTQNQTLDGTNNVAPNQTAASGSSIMTRDLVDNEHLFAMHKNRRLAAYAFGNSGASSFAGQSEAHGGAVGLAAQATSGYARATLARGINNTSVLTGSGINFARRMAFGFVFSCSLSPVGAVRFIVGGNGGVPAAADSDALSALGFGLEVVESAVNVSLARARLFAFGASYVTSGWSSDFSKLAQVACVVISDGAGEIALHLDVAPNATQPPARPPLAPTLTLSGGPTTSGNSTNSRVDFVAVNPSTGSITSGTSFVFFDGTMQLS